MKSFLQFVPIGTQASTASVQVCIARTGDALGVIAWAPAWRQYAFAPTAGRTYTRTTMQHIARKMGTLGRQWLARRRLVDPTFTPQRGAPIPKPVKYARRGRPQLEREV